MFKDLSIKNKLYLGFGSIVAIILILLGVAYNTHVIEAILTHVAPALGWR